MRRIVSLGLVAVMLGTLAVAIMPVLNPQPVLGMSGSGTSGDPWIVMNITDLQAIGTGSYALSHYYELGGNIDASATRTWNWDDSRGVYEGWRPINNFDGHFDGNNYIISGLYMNYVQSYYWVGLFGYMTSKSPTIQNVRIYDADIKQKYDSNNTGAAGAGVLIGHINGGSPQISRVVVHGSVDVEYWDYRWNPVYAGSAGGLIGRMNASSTTVEQCAAYVDVNLTVTGWAGGGAGGLVGMMGAQFSASHHISNSYARGSVTGLKDTSYVVGAGGLIGTAFTSAGYIPGYVTNCYSTGSVTAYTCTEGGLIGAGSSIVVTSSFWDKQTSGQTTSAGGTGKPTSEMKTQSTFTNAGWDFDTIWSIGGAVNNGYPYFGWWYDPPDMIDDVYQVVWFQPNAIIQGTTLPNRADEVDGIITWGTNPAGINITYSMLAPEKEYQFEPFLPPALDIIDPEPGGMTRDVDIDRLKNNPLRPLVQVLSAGSSFTERLAWLGLAIFILIALMVYVQLKTTHIVFTSLVGLGVAASFYLIGVFPLWVVVLLVFGLVGSIIYERMPVL